MKRGGFYTHSGGRISLTLRNSDASCRSTRLARKCNQNTVSITDCDTDSPAFPEFELLFGVAIEGVSSIVAEIAAASDEQSSNLEQVNQAISQIDQVTQQNAALVEESAAAAQAMQEQSANLRRAVSAFRLGAT